MRVVSAMPRPLYPRERPGTHCTGGWMGPRTGLDGCGKSRPPPGFYPRTVQPVASRYTDWAIPAHIRRGYTTESRLPIQYPKNLAFLLILFFKCSLHFWPGMSKDLNSSHISLSPCLSGLNQCSGFHRRSMKVVLLEIISAWCTF